MTDPAKESKPSGPKPVAHPKLDLVSDPTGVTPGLPANERRSRDSRRDYGQGDKSARPFVGVQFECCSIYARIYRNAAGTAYVGNCPRCAKKIELKIGPGGSDSRFFTAG
jgi:hypothetical protein